MDKNNNPTIQYISNYFYIQNTYRLKIKTWKKKFQKHSNQKKSEVAILMSDKIDFKSKIVITQKTLKKR